MRCQMNKEQNISQNCDKKRQIDPVQSQLLNRLHGKFHNLHIRVSLNLHDIRWSAGVTQSLDRDHTRTKAYNLRNYSAYSSFTRFLRYFRTQMVTYTYMLTFSVRKSLELGQNLNTLNSY